MAISIRLDPGATGSLVTQLKGEIRRQVAAGILRPGDRLPPTRQLARDLGIHRGTAASAYAELAEEGVLHSQVGRGTFVSADPTSEPFSLPTDGGGFRWRDHFGGFEPPPRERSLESVLAQSQDVETISFASNVPDRKRLTPIRQIKVAKVVTTNALCRMVVVRHLVTSNLRSITGQKMQLNLPSNLQIALASIEL